MAHRSVKIWQAQVPFSEQLLDLCVKEDDVKEVFPSLMKVSSHWYAVGVALGVPMHKLDEIRSNYHDTGTLTMLAQMIHYWINNTYTPTWRSLIEALYTLGYKTAVSAVIADAGRVILEHCESCELPPKCDYVETTGQLVSTDVFIAEIRVVEKREREMFDTLGKLLNSPIDETDIESLLDSINQHLLSRPSLTRNQVKEIVFTINFISEEFMQHLIILEEQVHKLDENMRNKGSVRSKLITTKQKLQEQLSRVNEELKIIKLAYAQEPNKLEKLKSTAKKEIILHDVRSELEKCVAELQCVSGSYQALREALGECEIKVQEASRQNRELREISTSCKTVTEAYFESSPFFLFLGLLLVFIQIEITLPNVVDHFSFVTVYIFTCGVILLAGGHCLKFIFQHPFIHGRVSEIMVHLIDQWGGISVVILVVAYPTSTVFLLMCSAFVGFYSVMIFSRQSCPMAQILPHRLGVFTTIYTGTEFIANLSNNLEDGFRVKADFLPFVIFFAGCAYGLLSTFLLILQFDVIKSGQLRDPLQCDICSAIVVCVIASVCYKMALGCDIYRLASALGILAGVHVGLTCFGEKILFHPPPEDDVLDNSNQTFKAIDARLQSTTKKKLALRSEIDRLRRSD